MAERAQSSTASARGRTRLVARLRGPSAPEGAPPERVVLLQDDPDDLQDDVFGHGDYAMALANAIAGAPNGLTFGLFGPWGIGKSSVLHALERHVSKGTVVVRFDAWRYREDAFRREFLYDITAQLVDSGSLRGFDVDRDLRDLDVDVSRPTEVFALSWRRLVQLAVALTLLAIAWLATEGAVVDTTQSSLTLVAIIGLVTWATGRVDRLLELRTETESQRRLEEADRFSRRFREIVGSVRAERCVIAVDNVDRLDSEAALHVLSTIKTFLEPGVRRPRRRLANTLLRRPAPAPLVTFIVAIDDRALRAHLAEIAPDTAMTADEYADEFLRKFFAVRVAVRPLLDDDLRTFIEKQVSPLIQRWTPAASEGLLEESAEVWAARQTVQLVELIIAGLRANPRRVKQFVNSLEMALTLIAARRASGKIDDPGPELALLGQLVFIEEEFPVGFEALTRNDQLLDQLHAAAQDGEVGPWDDDPGWARLVPVLRATYSVDRRSARTYLRLKVTDAERELPDREAVLAALRVGDLDDVRARLDPAYAFDAQDVGPGSIAARSGRARPWASRIPGLVGLDLRAGRHDAAMNLLRAALEIDVIRFHRSDVARAVEQAIASGTDLRAGLWRLDPAVLLDLADELSDVRLRQLLDALGDAYARNSDVGGQRRADLAVFLAPFASQIGDRVAASIRAAISVQPRASEFDYAPLVAARPDLLTNEAISGAWNALDVAIEADARRTEDGRSEAGGAVSGFLDGLSGSVLRTAIAHRVPIDDVVARRLVAALASSAADDLTRAALLDLIAEAVIQTETLAAEGADLLLTEIAQDAQDHVTPAWILAAAALLDRGGHQRGPGTRLAHAIVADPPRNLALAIPPVDNRLDGQLRGVILKALRVQQQNAPDDLSVRASITLLDPIGLARDVDRDALATELQSWMTGDTAQLAIVRAAIQETFSSDDATSIDSVRVCEIAELHVADGDDPDVYHASVRFTVASSISKPGTADDELTGCGVVDAHAACILPALVRLRRLTDGTVSIRAGMLLRSAAGAR